jgi:hypothetical protein
MIFPTEPDALQNCVRYLVERCLSTRADRDKTYQWREKYYLFGTQGYESAKYNRLESHLDLVTSFLYAPDHAFFHIAADSNAEDRDVMMATALQDDFNEDFQEAGISDVIMSAIPWSLVYDTMLVKQGWNRDRNQWFAELVPPHNFGVYREGISDLDSQQCFTHTYLMDYQVAAGKMILAGRESDLERLKVQRTDAISPFPEMLQRMIVAGTGGSNLAGTIFGQTNPDYSPSATYQPRTEVPLVRFTELWAWDDSCLDYRTFHMLEPDLLIGDSKATVEAYQKATKNVEYLFDKMRRMGKEPSRSNLFYPGEQPFAKIQPFPKYNYFWGKAHIDALIPLQEWMLERLDQIADILERQAYPARVGSGFMGLSEEKMAAFGGPDTYLFDQLPNAKVEELRPDMPPDIFTEFKEITAMFLEASGLTEVAAGQGTQGVRSKSHAQQLQKSGSGRIKKAALMLETPIVKIGDVGLKLKQANDDDPLRTAPGEDGKPHEFLACDVKKVKMRVDGHSHSPLFGDESRELAVVFRKLGTIDDADFIRMTNPPARDTLLHNLRRRQKRAQQMRAQGLAPQPGQQQGRSGKKK